ncbi:huntingtin-associated protein 1 isoform X3 [Nannospalax galili]|uniref:huntingtin-associated protein 1 isoform X3 n=1 Tax=Nannospalax galili TaxID=1026970 RepID=UPI0004ED272E|nr:huntingtin-associated protein 1 isoform X3 [Nannospalax galili]
MRPKEQVQTFAGDGPGSGPGLGDPAAATPAIPPAAGPAPEPSAEPEPAPAQGPGAGQRAGFRPPSASQAGARQGSQAGAKTGAQRRSDAPWTRFVFQGPFGPRATGLGTGKAEGIWKTPAAYIGRRPGVSGPERAAFIRELQEALCPNPPPTKKITDDDIKVMLYLLEEKERDLNTAARIGQSLVKQNSVLMEENSKLETMLGSAREEILHLRKQVNLRDDLLQLYSDSDEEDEDEEEDEEDEEEDEEDEEEDHEGQRDQDRQHDHPYGAPKPPPKEESLHHCPQLEALQQKLRLLEKENDQLKEEASHLDTLEDEEQMLILECVEQFSEASQQMAELSEVLVLRLEGYERQQKEITQLQAQITKLQQRCQSYGAETERLQQQLALEKGIRAEGPREKYTDLGIRRQEEAAKRQHSSMPAGSVAHYGYSVPLDALPSFPEALAQELRTSLRRVVADPAYLMEKTPRGMPVGETSNPGCDLHHREKKEQQQASVPPKDPMPPEDFEAPEELVPEEELGAIEEVGTAEEEAEQASEETEAWEEVEPELDEATKMSVVVSALEASGLGPSHLDMKYVLQQLASWQDAHSKQQLKQKILQKGSPALQQMQAKANLGSGTTEQQPGTLTQEDKASHPPRAREEEGPSGAT